MADSGSRGITVPGITGVTFAGDANGPIWVSLDKAVQVSPPDAAYPEGRLQLDRLGSDNLAPLIVGGQINPALAANTNR